MRIYYMCIALILNFLMLPLVSAPAHASVSIQEDRCTIELTEEKKAELISALIRADQENQKKYIEGRNYLREEKNIPESQLYAENTLGDTSEEIRARVNEHVSRLSLSYEELERIIPYAPGFMNGLLPVPQHLLFHTYEDDGTYKWVSRYLLLPTYSFFNKEDTSYEFSSYIYSLGGPIAQEAWYATALIFLPSFNDCLEKWNAPYRYYLDNKGEFIRTRPIQPGEPGSIYKMKKLFTLGSS